MKKVYLLPVAHISKKSIASVENEINNIKPDVVAVELCYSRFKGIMSGKKRLIPSLNPLHLILYYFQQSIGWAVGIEPGQEMKIAILTAQKNKIKVALIDMPIQHIMKGLSSVPLNEWGRAMFSKEKVDLDLSSLLKQDIMNVLNLEKLESILSKFKKHLPTVYKVMLGNRNQYMSNGLMKLLETNDTIICVIGAGHLPGIIEILKEKYKNDVSVDVIWPK